MFAPLFVVVSLGNAIGETWLYDWVGAVVEATLLLLVVRIAWAWPRELDRPTANLGAAPRPR